MSWVKKRGQNSTQGGPPPVPMYNPNQHNQENQWPQGQEAWFNQQGNQGYWPQNYNNQEYYANAPNYTPSTFQPTPNNYPNNGGYAAQNLQYNQQFEAQNNVPVAQEGGDAWGTNWGWGDEDNSNVQNVQPPKEDTWNWGVEESPPVAKLQEQPDGGVKQHPQIDRLTRAKMETPQWSVESQVSQESSDDVVQTSESDKSRMLSRSSTISHSPALEHADVPFENKEILSVQPLKKPAASVQPLNLEMLPDNSEQPDLVPVAAAGAARKLTPPAWQENDEAPINDRNQYLETAPLSDAFTRGGESLENDTLPPPGLRRMVPGQLENTPSSTEPPEGLRRMVPGESSSPENSRRNDDVELTRLTTIGADTPIAPPNRSEAIGADAGQEEKRRDSIEGAGLAAAVKNLRVDDEGVGSEDDRRPSSESEREAKTPERRERRYREKERRRYSPDRRRYRERRYEEDTDYYSDKERERKHRDEREYDRKYHSLRKEKEKERRRREYGREPPRKSDYYYGRYEDDYEEPRSRASSRSDSMHEAYRERGQHDRERREKRRDKERHRDRRHRDPFNPYQNMGYDVYSQYYQQYQYYEHLRKTNPQAYAQFYRKYYQTEPPYMGEDRASVHSGRSSANDELAKDRYTRQSYYSQTSLPQIGGYYRGSQTHSISGQYGLDESSYSRTFDQTDASINNYEEQQQQQLTSQRLTPPKFSTAYLKASIASGTLIKILPNYPLDGQAAVVELCNFESLLQNDDDYKELKLFPGPLVKGATHKKTIIEYCENKIKAARFNTEIHDYDSYVLLWELLILLIRQNGVVVGADIAELLLKGSEAVPPRASSVASSAGSNVLEEDGGGPAGLKEEEVTGRFREYLLYGSGKEALEWAMKQGLWGHALFLASKLDKRTYANVLMRFANGLAMNDPLQTLYQLLSGRTPAAVTCIADEKWGDWRPHLAMILSNSSQRPELNCKAIASMGDTLMSRGSLYAAQFCYLMSEASFGQYGDPSSKLVLLGANINEPFRAFATNEAIHMTEIYEYARSLNDAEFTLANFQRYKHLVACRLADVGLLEKALAYLEKIGVWIVKDPAGVEKALIDDVVGLGDRLKYFDPVGDGEDELENRVESLWLNDLKRIQSDYSMGLIPAAVDEAPVSTEQWQQPAYEFQQPQWANVPAEPAPVDPPENTSYPQQFPEQSYWQNQWGAEPQSQSYQGAEQPPPPDASYYGSHAQPEPAHKEPDKSEAVPPAPPTHEDAEPAKEPPREQPERGKPAGNGWFGGIFNKLSLKPKNQMKLPDDKNPSIVWDSEKKRWVNTDADPADGSSEFKPPPKMAVRGTAAPPAPELAPVGGAPGNMFKMQRSRNLKKSYVDVFNSGGGAVPGAAPPPQGPTPVAPMNFFIPQPMNDPNAPVDFLTPAPPLHLEDAQSAQ